MLDSKSEVDRFSTQYGVSVWEGFAIAAGAGLLAIVGMAGLGLKALNNAFDPERAKAIASSMMSYQLSDPVEGVFGANVGGAKLAVLRSTALPQELSGLQANGTPLPAEQELLMARIPIDEEIDRNNPEENIANQLMFSGFSFSYQDEDAFQINETHSENKLLCNQSVPVTVETGVLQIDDPNQEDVSLTVAAVRYQTWFELGTDNQLLSLAATGYNARSLAEETFQSLECRVSP